MTEDRVLSFPSPQDDADLAARLAALYEATPSVDATQSASRAAACTRAVLQRAASESETVRRGGIAQSRWWWGAAAAAALVVVAVRFGGLNRTPSGDVASSAAGGGAGTTLLASTTPIDGGTAVRFEVRLPAGTHAVAIVGDFNGWSGTATPMQRQVDSGAWSASVPLLPGRHVYAFVVNGEQWLVDPLAPQVPDVGFGPSNALVLDGDTK